MFETVKSWYPHFGYEMVEVPIGTLDDRVDFIESSVAKALML